MKTVCVVGGGVAGVAVTKELLGLGIAVDCFEMMPRVGGVFASHVWNGGQLTSSSIFTWFSDFPVTNRQTFFTWEEMLDYLDRYVEHFKVKEKIQLNCKIVSARREEGRWRVQVHRKNWSNGHPYHPNPNIVEEAIFERFYDHLVVCSGLHNEQSIPEVPGLDSFSGQILHSSTYRDAEVFRNKRVVVVGSGESASDIALQIAPVAYTCTISIRSAPGTLVPRWIQGNTPDIRDDRLTYNLPHILAPLILWGHRAFYYEQKERPELFRWAADSNYKNKRCPFNTNACKSFGIPEAIIDHKAELYGEIQRADKNTLYFADNISREVDAVIFCTGFIRRFAFLHPTLSAQLIGIKHLWKNVVHPDLGDSIFLVGFTRPQQINLVSIAEMQSRLVGQLLSGRMLPSAAQMREDIEADQAWMHRYYGVRYEKNPALVDYLYYMDGMAKFIGCSIPRFKSMLDPHLWFKLHFASLNGAHYRLAGPGADWKAAAATIKATPLFSNKRKAIRRWVLLSFLTIFSAFMGIFQKKWRLVSDQARP